MEALTTFHDIIVEEKVDGSQFSFGIGEDGVLRTKSKTKEFPPDHPEPMFAKGCEVAMALAPRLTKGWTYRCEYLQSPRHNTITYSRVPAGHLIIFDVTTGHETYLGPHSKKVEAERLGLEVVPLLGSGMFPQLSVLKEYMHRESILGGAKIEGVVLKPGNYSLFGPDKKVIMAKFVSEAFKEAHRDAWKKSNPTRTDSIEGIINALSTPARWQKAVQHLREEGRLKEALTDIGPLMKEVVVDVEKEERQLIMDRLWARFWPDIRRGLTRGLPQWYKEKLAADMLTGVETPDAAPNSDEISVLH